MDIQKLIERLQAEIGKLTTRAVVAELAAAQAEEEAAALRDALETQAAATTPEPEPAVDFDDMIERAEAREARL
ncbi:hypothetical protein [Corynebacterium variabile]|uniref:hypothetical protein n=1 Tax=Corynebacterium variabile TaxID=1727 RepID=UPI003BB0FF67